MKRSPLTIALILFFVLLLGAFIGFRFFTPAEFRAQANPASSCETAVFDKSALVFDHLLICATKDVPPDKLAHAAYVAAEWLDNNEDGQIDEPRLLDAFEQNKPVVLMSASGISPVVAPRLFSAFDGYRIQDLYASETNPSGEQRDASQEEIHHIIMNAGWQTLDPATFSESASDNSTLYQTWLLADQERFYVYNDPTCDSSCKVTEFVYLATAAYMETGAEKDLASDEMRLNNRAELAENVPTIIQIFESDQYSYPTNHWPDGRYPHPSNIRFEGVQ
ncbi:MAG: hypothetical protein AAF490_15510 [Chloroflexota bacterium]